MDFCFLTKDRDVDYNIIDWIPSDFDLSFLEQWRKFNFQDAPELLVIREKEKWRVYITTLPTGRKDTVFRDIQVTLVITGTVDEGSQIFGLLTHIYKYLQNGYTRNESADIREAISDYIHEGEPLKWKDYPTEKSKTIANGLGERILKQFGPSESIKVQWTSDFDRWYGCDDDARDCFQNACEALLTQKGIESGVASALIGIGLPEINRVFLSDKKWDKMALLIKNDNDVDGIVEIPKPEDIDSNIDGGTGGGTDGGKTSPWNNHTIHLILIIALICVFGFCVNKYNKFCNNRAISKFEQTIENGKEISPKALKRVTKLAKKNNPDAERALGSYYSSNFEQAVKKGDEIAPETLTLVTKLAEKNIPGAEYAMGCYYSSNKINDLKKAEVFFNLAVQHGNATLQEKAKTKLNEIKNAIENQAKTNTEK